MEVPIINNLIDNGDRQKPKGKDVFKDQQKESEVNLNGVECQSTAAEAAGASGGGARWSSVCMCMCMCVRAYTTCVYCPFHALSRCPGSKAAAWRQAGRQRGVILATGSYK